MEQQTESAVESTIARIREAIRSGTFAPGQRLVVADLCKRLGVSAGPVREAIRRLTGESLVDITPHKGATVREFGAREVREIFEVREMIESGAARLAAERIGKADYRARLQRMLADMRRVVSEREDYIPLNQAFHELIYEMADNRRVIDIATQLTLPIYRLRFHNLMSHRFVKTSAEEHEAIAGAILAGDGDAAERAMRVHIRSSRDSMLESLDFATSVA
jgi:DNA-binding GntR family transcriptional regulator